MHQAVVNSFAKHFTWRTQKRLFIHNNCTPRLARGQVFANFLHQYIMAHSFAVNWQILALI